MEFVKVESSNVEEVAYNPDTSELHVRFKNNSLYVYELVTQVDYELLIEAESVGKYLNSHIKPTHIVRRIE